MATDLQQGVFALRAQGVSKAYASRRAGVATVDVLDGVGIEVRPGERVAIQGQSGVGKTTLLNVLGGLDRADAGEILHGGRPIPEDPDDRARWRRGAVGFIFQFHGLLAELTAHENVALAGLVCGWNRSRALDEAAELLDGVGLGSRLGHYPDELSGGEQQRVSVARALLPRPRTVLADEPTGNLDPRTGDRILDLLFALQEEHGFGMLVASHSDRLARRCHRILLLEDGRLVPAPTAPTEARDT